MGPVDSPPAADIEQTSVTQRVLHALRQDIVTGKLQPEQVLRESEIATRLGVSKTPVREALQSLLAEDFVMVFPRRGYVVRPVGVNDIRDIMDLRMSIEPPIAGIAALRRGAELVERLEEFLARQSDENLDFDQRLKAASDFHRAIAATAGNRRAERLLRTYFDETTRMHYLFSRVSDHVVSGGELDAHRAILQAIADKDEAAARQAMVEHLKESNEALLRSFY